MCGFTGFLGNSIEQGSQYANVILNKMADQIISRGPDDSGYWYDESGIALAHRRLSIVDLSMAGHQPMICHTGRYIIAFNGEIYNHLQIRFELTKSNLSPEWRGHSDTETLLAGFVAWGIEATIKRCIGMFAFAVWDKRDSLLTLGRDRLGEKPLYYGWQGTGRDSFFLFGSDLKSLKVHPAFSTDINRDSLRLYLRHNSIPAPHTIYNNIFKLMPGHILTVSLALREPKLAQYWSLIDVAVNGVKSPFADDSTYLVDQLDILLTSAVKQQMMADVPLGAFLSGGIDSSTIVALMQAQSNRAIKTFSIGFNEEGFNEAVHAKAVAKHLGTDHTELYVTPKDAFDVIPSLPSIYSEPFSDSSQLPTYLVSKLARSQVTVSLSGDAGDELFAGYGRYTQANDLWSKVSRLPDPFRVAAASSIRSLSPAMWNRLFRPLFVLKNRSLRHVNVGHKLYKGAELLSAKQIDELYLKLISHCEPDDLVIGGVEPLTCLRGKSPLLDGLNAIERMMALDAMTYLTDDILVKVDRAAMGVSLETRVPFLDHRVVEFAWKIPLRYKINDGVQKWILREVLYRYVPKELIERPKMGFGVPIDAWLRGPLKSWSEDLLSDARLKREGYFKPVFVRKLLNEHMSGHRNWQYQLWDILMFQAWLAEQ